MFTERPFVVTYIPEELIPKRESEDIEFNTRYAPKLVPALNYLVDTLSQKHILKDALLKEEIYHPVRFGFRGVARFIQENIPLRADRPDSTLKVTLKSIHEGGHEKPHSNKVWFTGQPEVAFAYSLPHTSDQLGIIIISDMGGFEPPSDYWHDFGEDLKPGYTYKGIHIGTIIYSLRERLDRLYLEQYIAPHTPSLVVAA